MKGNSDCQSVSLLHTVKWENDLWVTIWLSKKLVRFRFLHNKYLNGMSDTKTTFYFYRRLNENSENLFKADENISQLIPKCLSPPCGCHQLTFISLFFWMMKIKVDKMMGKILNNLKLDMTTAISLWHHVWQTFIQHVTFSRTSLEFTPIQIMTGKFYVQQCRPTVVLQFSSFSSNSQAIKVFCQSSYCSGTQYMIHFLTQYKRNKISCLFSARLLTRLLSLLP